jgi:hypothetical protein
MPSASAAKISAPSYLSVVSLSLFRRDNAEDSAASIAHVPFDFEIGSVHFLAGAYSIEARNPEAMFHVRPAGREAPAGLVQAGRMPPQHDGMSRKLLFYRQDGKYHLAQVLAVDPI